MWFNLGLKYQMSNWLPHSEVSCFSSTAHCQLQQYSNTHFIYAIVSFPFQIHIYRGSLWLRLPWGKDKCVYVLCFPTQENLHKSVYVCWVVQNQNPTRNARNVSSAWRAGPCPLTTCQRKKKSVTHSHVSVFMAILNNIIL